MAKRTQRTSRTHGAAKKAKKKKAQRAVAAKIGHSLEHKLEVKQGITKPPTTYVFKLGFTRTSLSTGNVETLRTEVAAEDWTSAIEKVLKAGGSFTTGWELVFLDRLVPPNKSSQAF